MSTCWLSNFMVLCLIFLSLLEPIPVLAANGESAGWSFLPDQSECRLNCENGGVCAFNTADPSRHKCICFIGMFWGERCEYSVSDSPPTSIQPSEVASDSPPPVVLSDSEESVVLTTTESEDPEDHIEREGASYESSNEFLLNDQWRRSDGDSAKNFVNLDDENEDGEQDTAMNSPVVSSTEEPSSNTANTVSSGKQQRQQFLESRTQLLVDEFAESRSGGRPVPVEVVEESAVRGHRPQKQQQPIMESGGGMRRVAPNPAYAGRPDRGSANRYDRDRNWEDDAEEDADGGWMLARRRYYGRSVATQQRRWHNLPTILGTVAAILCHFPNLLFLFAR